MARIIYGALVESIRGSIGGTTFQRNAYGFTVKCKPNMIRPSSPEQAIWKEYLTRATQAWRSLTFAGRANWETWASVNPQYARNNPSSQLTGFACFVKWHVQSFILGGTIEPAPDLAIPALSPVTFQLKLIANVLTLHASGNENNEGWILNIFVSRPMGAAQNFVGTKTRSITSLGFEDPSFNMTARYVALFGKSPIVGDRVALDYINYMSAGGKVMERAQVILTVLAV